MPKPLRNILFAPMGAATISWPLTQTVANFSLISVVKVIRRVPLGAGASHGRCTDLSYHHTGDQSFLDTAKRCANYCIANMAVNDWLPLVDYRQPAEVEKYDSTAAMCTACGLLEIASHVEENEARFYTGL